MDKKADNKHSLWLDLLRIFACMCVVMLHSMGYYITSTSMYGTKTWYACILLNAIVRTGVPLFLMMSGYLLLSNPHTSEIVTFYKKRLIRILLPFIVWDVIYFLYFRYVNGSTAGILDFFRELINNGSAYHLWYVYTLAAIYLVTPFIRMIVEKCSIKQLTWLFILIIFTGTIRPFLNTVLPVYIYLFEPVAEGYIGYFLLGYILGKTEQSKYIRVLIYFGGIAGLVYGVWQNIHSSDSASVVLSANGGYAINQFLCAAAVFTLFKYMFRSKNESTKSAKFISLFASVTYGIYLAHPLVLEIIRRNPTGYSPAVDIIICFMAALLIPAAVLIVMKKLKYVIKFFS